ncbi:recombinase family protein [Pseudomonas savastanoi]|nr:recombinase family protein [Pseudomonas savastanoi]
MASTCNHRVFRPGLFASIRASKPGIFANEPAFIWLDLQLIVMNRNYLRMPLAAMPTRPELIRLLKDARRGDVLLVESINRLSRMDDQACRSLKKAIDN